MTVRDGRASTEIRRRWDRRNGNVHEEEWVILDPVGRLQLPRAYVNHLEMRELVRLHLEPDHISVWPNGDDEERTTDGERQSPVSHLWSAVGDQLSDTGVSVTAKNRIFSITWGESVRSAHFSALLGALKRLLRTSPRFIEKIRKI